MKSNPLIISNSVTLSMNDIELSFIRAQGAGGQNVNKVATAVHLRFGIANSTIPDFYKDKLLAFKDHHITADGIIIIKSQSYRTQDKNREDALLRLVEIIKNAVKTKKKRVPTKVTRASRQRRMDGKTKAGQQKQLRNKVSF